MRYITALILIIYTDLYVCLQAPARSRWCQATPRALPCRPCAHGSSHSLLPGSCHGLSRPQHCSSSPSHPQVRTSDHCCLNHHRLTSTPHHAPAFRLHPLVNLHTLKSTLLASLCPNPWIGASSLTDRTEACGAIAASLQRLRRAREQPGAWAPPPGGPEAGMPQGPTLGAAEARELMSPASHTAVQDLCTAAQLMLEALAVGGTWMHMRGDLWS